MKIYQPQPPEKNVRITIRKVGHKSIHITFHECTHDEVLASLKSLIKDKANPFAEGKRTAIDVREYIGGNPLKSEAFSFHGLDPQEVEQLILTNYPHT